MDSPPEHEVGNGDAYFHSDRATIGGLIRKCALPTRRPPPPLRSSQGASAPGDCKKSLNACVPSTKSVWDRGRLGGVDERILSWGFI